MTPKWIDFVDVSQRWPTRKTKTWWVTTKDKTQILATIAWHPAWRAYAMAPAVDTIFEPTCLRDIATFLEQQTRDRRRLRAQEKAAGL